jgi:outer membrane protein
MSKICRLATICGLASAFILPSVLDSDAASDFWQLPELPQMPALDRLPSMPKVPEGWSVSLGAGLLTAPEYEGSDNYDVFVLPSLRFSYGSNLSFNARQGLRYNFLNENGITVGAGLGGNFGREEDDSSYLTGLGDIDPTVEGKVFADYRVGLAKASFTFAHDLAGSHKGFTVKSALGTAFPIPGYGVFVRPSISATYASDDYVDSFFGINATQAARSGLVAYNPDAGFKDVGVNLFATKQLTQHWSASSTLSYKYLLGDVADSPIVKEKGQASAGLFVSYKF